MEKELYLVFIFMSILNQQIYAQKEHFCNVTESYFVEVTKTETITETKKPSGFNLLGVLFGGSPFNKYENVTRQVQGVEKKERVVEVCCKGYKPKGSECVPMDESKTETKTTSKPTTASSSTTETTTHLPISSTTVTKPVPPPENPETTAVIKAEIVAPSIEPIRVEKLTTAVPSTEIITSPGDSAVAVPSTENVALSEEPVQTNSPERLITKIVTPPTTVIPTDPPQSNPPEPLIATTSHINVEMESATTTSALMITEIMMQNTATNSPPVIENANVDNHSSTVMINENTHVTTETVPVTSSVIGNTEILSEYTRRRRNVHVFTDSNQIAKEENTFKPTVPITSKKTQDEQISLNDLIDQRIREEVEVKTLEVEENNWIGILEMFSFGAILLILVIAVQTAYNNEGFTSSWKVRNDSEDSEFGTQFEYISHIFIEEV